MAEREDGKNEGKRIANHRDSSIRDWSVSFVFNRETSVRLQKHSQKNSKPSRLPP